MGKKVYLSGPMSGKPDLNFDAFHAMAAQLRVRGYDVMSPAEQDIIYCGGDENLARRGVRPKRDALRYDLFWICAYAQIVAVLPDWEESSGVLAEVYTAFACQIPVYLAVDLVEKDECLCQPITPIVSILQLPEASSITSRTPLPQLLESPKPETTNTTREKKCIGRGKNQPTTPTV